LLKLPFVTLIAVSSIKILETIRALDESTSKVRFGNVKLITDAEIKHPSIEIVKCNKLDSIDKYNEFIFLNLWKYIDTEFVLIQQYDSFVLWPEEWRDDWIDFDFLGAPWPIVENSYIANDGTRARVGNGGFSLRSSKLLRIPSKMGWDLREEQGQKSEDGQFACYYRKELLKEGIRYAPVEVAAHFSFENYVPENQDIVKTFGFHKNWRKEWLTN